MDLELSDNYHIWKIKLQLAKQGNSQAIQELKAHCLAGTAGLSFIQKNFNDVLRNSQIKFVKQAETYGNYQMYYQVPIFLLLQGQIELKCLNLQGDEQLIQKYEQKGAIFLTKEKVIQKFEQANVNIVTKFHLSCSKDSILIEISEQSRRKIQSTQNQAPSLVGSRQQSIMKKYMFFPLKYIRIQEYNLKNGKYQQKMYILQGRACYYYQKDKQRHLLTVYEQGYINPKQFQNSQVNLYIFQNSKILIFEEEFMRDDVIAGVESKRNEHIQALIKAYKTFSVQQKRKIQIKLTNNYQLNKKQVERNVLGIIQPPLLTHKEQSFKKISNKNDLISTSSSMKQRCRIRISKKKKVI